MKRVVYIVVLMIVTSQFAGCGVLAEVVTGICQEYTNTVEKMGGKDQDPIGAYGFAKAWQSGNAGKGLALSRLGVSAVGEISGIKTDGVKAVLDSTTNWIIADPKSSKDEKSNLIRVAAYGGWAAANHIAKKIDDKNYQERYDAFMEQTAKYRDPDSPYYDPYFESRYDLSTFKKRDPIDVMNEIKQIRKDAEMAQERELMLKLCLIEAKTIRVGEDDGGLSEYMKLLSDPDRIREARCRVQEWKRRSGYSEAIYNRYVERRMADNSECDDVSNELTTQNPSSKEASQNKSQHGHSDSITHDAPQSAPVVVVVENNIIDGFQFNSIELSLAQKTELDTVVEMLKADNSLRVEITGHTCNIGTDKANMSMGLKRAQNAKAYLTKHGVEASVIEVNSLGATQPLCDNLTSKNRASNRRISVKILK